MFLDELKFQEIIEEMVLEVDCTYLEAVVKYAEDNSIDIEDLKNVISGPLKTKIMDDAMNSGLMKRTARLPI